MCEYGQEKEKKHDLIIIKHNSQQEQHKQLSEDGSGGAGRTSRARTSPLTLLAMLAAWGSLEASLISVTRKFLHFFTLSRVSC